MRDAHDPRRFETCRECGKETEVDVGPRCQHCGELRPGWTAHPLDAPLERLVRRSAAWIRGRFGR